MGLLTCLAGAAAGERLVAARVGEQGSEERKQRQIKVDSQVSTWPTGGYWGARDSLGHCLDRGARRTCGRLTASTATACRLLGFQQTQRALVCCLTRDGGRGHGDGRSSLGGRTLSSCRLQRGRWQGGAGRVGRIRAKTSEPRLLPHAMLQKLGVLMSRAAAGTCRPICTPDSKAKPRRPQPSPQMAVGGAVAPLPSHLDDRPRCTAHWPAGWRGRRCFARSALRLGILLSGAQQQTTQEQRA